MSISPNSLTALPTAAFISAGLVTSATSGKALPPPFLIASETFIDLAMSWLPRTAMLAPSLANNRADASPMPLVAPVMNATFPFNLPNVFLPSSGAARS